MKIVYNNGKTWSGTLEDAIYAFSDPLKIGDFIRVKSYGSFTTYKIESIKGDWIWVWQSSSPSGSFYVPGLEYTFPGFVDGVRTDDILGTLKKAAEAKAKAKQAKAAAKAKEAAEALRAYITHLEFVNRDPKFCKGDIVKGINGLSYKIKEIHLERSGNFYYDVEYCSDYPVTCTLVSEDSFVGLDRFEAGSIVKYRNGRDHYRVVTYNQGFYSLYSLNNHKDYYDVEHKRLVQV